MVRTRRGQGRRNQRTTQRSSVERVSGSQTLGGGCPPGEVVITFGGIHDKQRLLANAAAVVRPGWTLLFGKAHHLVERVGGLQRNGDMTLNTPQVAEGPEHVIAAAAGNAACWTYCEQLQCFKKGRTDVSAGPVDLPFGIRPCHGCPFDLPVRQQVP